MEIGAPTYGLLIFDSVSYFTLTGVEPCTADRDMIVVIIVRMMDLVVFLCQPSLSCVHGQNLSEF